MSLKSELYYTVICDHPGCGVSADADGEYSAWRTKETAYEMADCDDWQISNGEGPDFCPEHRPDYVDDADSADPTVQVDTLPIEDL